MKKIILGALIGIVVLSAAGVVVGKIIPANEKAVANSPVIDEGSSLTTPLVEKIVFIHYKKGFGKPGTECGNNICEPGENARKCPADCNGGEEPVSGSKCYGVMARGAKFKSVKDLVIHPDLDLSTILASTQRWDDNTTTSLFGGYTVDKTADWDNKNPDGRNEFSLGDYSEPGVIAITIAWGYFSGPPQIREIIEFDIMFDTDFSWGDADLNPEVMDLENIAVHEIGHGVGLADIYDGSCGEVTMYGYSTEGETKKRSLEQADIVGLQSLYGN
jgi:hypothetical protein